MTTLKSKKGRWLHYYEMVVDLEYLNNLSKGIKKAIEINEDIELKESLVETYYSITKIIMLLERKIQMTTLELYTKFIASSRKPQKAFFEDKFTRNSIRSSLYSLRKKNKEIFVVVQSGHSLTIADRVSII